MLVEHQRLAETIDLDRPSPLVLATYGDDSLAGYGDAVYDKGGDTLAQQQRGLILPTLEGALASRADGARVVEIGTGNGDVIAHLARTFPRHRFQGIDFSTATAERKHHGLANVSFSSGYALDLSSSGALAGDVVFASSTFVVFPPKELQAYIAAIRDAGFEEIVVNSPTWAGYVQRDDDTVLSRHLEGAAWYHNFAGISVRAATRSRSSASSRTNTR